MSCKQKFETEVLHRLTRIELLLRREIQNEEIMSKEMDDLQTSVSRNTSVVSSALTLIQGFSAQLAAAGTDPTKLAALKKSLDDSDDSLAAAVAANTVSATPPPPSNTMPV